MILECSICGMQIETANELEDGQRVRCPFCQGKFSYCKPTPAAGLPLHKHVFGRLWIVIIIVALVIVSMFLLLRHGLSSEELPQSIAVQGEELTAGHGAAVDMATVKFEQPTAESQKRVTEEDERRNAAAALRTYLEREGEFLNGIVTESDASIKIISDDQRRLSSVLAEIESANARLEAVAKTNGWKRYERAERVMMILKHPAMNELAVKYLGEDFAVLRAECRSRIKTLLEMQKDTSRRLKANRDKYFRAQSGIDDDVEAKTEAAGKMTTSANKELETRLADLEARRDGRTAKLLELKKRPSKPHTIVNEINSLQEEIIALEKEIVRVREVVNVSRANVSHIAATVAETTARRRGDSALSARQDDDNAVHSDMAHVRSVFSLAVNYEGRSLDALRGAMRSKVDVLSTRRQDAKRRLDYIHHASANMDMMSKDDLEALKRKIAARLGDEILEVSK